MRTKITRASCRKRTGTAVPRAEHFGDLITADHKVLSDNCESRNNHRYAVVVQDLATQWICKPEKKRRCMSSNWTCLSRLCFLVKLPQFFVSGSCDDHGYTYLLTSGQKPYLTKKGKRIDCNISNYVPFVVPGLFKSSSATPTPSSSSSSSQDSVFDVNRYTENPMPEKSGSMSEELRGNLLHKQAETENQNKNEERREVQSDLSHDLTAGFQRE